MLAQSIAPGILGGIVKGFKGGKPSQSDSTAIPTHNFAHLEDIFFKPPSSDSVTTVTDNEEVELNIGFLLNASSVTFYFRLYF